MIRINLLEVKHKKKTVQFQTLLLQTGLVLAVTLLVLAVFTFYITSRVSDLREEKAGKEKTLQEMQAKLKEVESYERDNAEFLRKSQIIEQLRKNQLIPAQLLDEVSNVIPDGVWLGSLIEEAGGVMALRGIGFSNTEIVKFVQNLKDSKKLDGVMLRESKLVASSGDATVYGFVINFTVKI